MNSSDLLSRKKKIREMWDSKLYIVDLEGGSRTDD